MKRSSNRILTTHAGSLSRPNDLIEMYRDNVPDSTVLPRLKSAVAEVVREQADAGVDIVNDGEFGKPTRGQTDYGAWWSYVYDRIQGYEIRPVPEGAPNPLQLGSRDRTEFRQFYEEDGGMGSGGGRASAGNRLAQLICTGPVKYTGQALIQRDIANFKAGLEGVAVEEAFLPSVSPATLQILRNEYYKDSRDYVWSLAEAIREEYRAIVDAGFLLQIDDPAIVDLYDWWFSLEKGMGEYRAWAEMQVEAVNHALEGIPEDRVRFHICWGSWHGPHTSDVPLKDVVDLVLKVKAQAYSVEAGNVRHEHEWKVWRDVAKLPEGKILIPGVVSHATNVIEHPELVADRLANYAGAVGRENVMAGTDCGLGGRIHPQLAWAKLRTLREGADLASQQLWR
jgi:5-methyltetrahydropteroyltriglutamate--homocysteine methyltransferase